jgi:hypothetical protein
LSDRPAEPTCNKPGPRLAEEQKDKSSQQQSFVKKNPMHLKMAVAVDFSPPIV